jgi:hypothetical protein
LEAEVKSKLEEKVMNLRASYLNVAKYEADLKEFILFTHRPGWTTIAEAILVEGLIDSMIKQMNAFEGLHRALMNGGREVGIG